MGHHLACSPLGMGMVIPGFPATLFLFSQPHEESAGRQLIPLKGLLPEGEKLEPPSFSREFRLSSWTFGLPGSFHTWASRGRKAQTSPGIQEAGVGWAMGEGATFPPGRPSPPCFSSFRVLSPQKPLEVQTLR